MVTLEVKIECTSPTQAYSCLSGGWKEPVLCYEDSLTLAGGGMVSAHTHLLMPLPSESLRVTVMRELARLLLVRLSRCFAGSSGVCRVMQAGELSFHASAAACRSIVPDRHGAGLSGGPRAARARASRDPVTVTVADEKPILIPERRRPPLTRPLAAACGAPSSLRNQSYATDSGSSRHLKRVDQVVNCACEGGRARPAVRPPFWKLN